MGFGMILGEAARLLAPKALPFLGKVGMDVAGGFMGNMFQRRAANENRRDLGAMGLTPWEINSGGGGAQGRGGGNTLGNGSQTLQRQQQRFQMQERAKDRATQVATAQITAAAPGIQAQEQVKRTPFMRDESVQRQASLSAGVNKLQAEVRKMDNELKYFWESKYAVMARENILMSIATYNQGLSMKNVLSGIQNPKDRAAAEKVFRDASRKDSAIDRETMGAANFIRALMRGMSPLSTRGEGDQTLGKLRVPKTPWQAVGQQWRKRKN